MPIGAREQARRHVAELCEQGLRQTQQARSAQGKGAARARLSGQNLVMTEDVPGGEVGVDARPLARREQLHPALEQQKRLACRVARRVKRLAACRPQQAAAVEQELERALIFEQVERKQAVAKFAAQEPAFLARELRPGAAAQRRTPIAADRKLEHSAFDAGHGPPQTLGTELARLL